jgi:hypothetical protein
VRGADKGILNGRSTEGDDRTDGHVVGVGSIHLDTKQTHGIGDRSGSVPISLGRHYRPLYSDDEEFRVGHSISPQETGEDRTEADEGIHLTDLGNARRLIKRHGQDLRFVRRSGWFVWAGKRWLPDDTAEVERRAKESILALYDEAKNLPDVERRAKLLKHALWSEAAPRIQGMIALASSEAPVVVRESNLDADPMVLNVENGTSRRHTPQLAALMSPRRCLAEKNAASSPQSR